MDKPFGFYDEKLPGEYEKLFTQIRRRSEAQKVAVLQMLKKYITNEEEYKLMCGMIDILLYHQEKKVRAETYIKSFRTTMKNIVNTIAVHDKMKLDVILDITDSKPEA